MPVPSSKTIIREAEQQALQTLKYLDGLADPSTSQDSLRFLSKADRCLQSLLTIMLTRWRFQMGPPEDAARQLLALSHRVTPIFDRADTHNHPFSFNTNVWVGILLEHDLSTAFLRCLPSAGSLEDLPLDYAWRDVDCSLFSLMQGELPFELWEGFVRDRLPDVFRSDHCCSTCQVYGELVRSLQNEDWNLAQELLHDAEALFTQRSEVEDYLCVEGGGPCNNSVLDYRIAGILHYVLRDHPEQLRSLKTIHSWPLRAP